MTQEDKDLLLKDLCGRLPYGVKIQTPTNCWTSEKNIRELKEIFKGDDGLFRIGDVGTLIEYSKPYLFPMSNMTDEQEEEYNNLNCYEGRFPRTEEALDYLIANHFDYRDLISMGLAFDATNLNIY